MRIDKRNVEQALVIMLAGAVCTVVGWQRFCVLSVTWQWLRLLSVFFIDAVLLLPVGLWILHRGWKRLREVWVCPACGRPLGLGDLFDRDEFSCEGCGQRVMVVWIPGGDFSRTQLTFTSRMILVCGALLPVFLLMSRSGLSWIGSLPLWLDLAALIGFGLRYLFLRRCPQCGAEILTPFFLDEVDHLHCWKCGADTKLKE